MKRQLSSLRVIITYSKTQLILMFIGFLLIMQSIMLLGSPVSQAAVNDNPAKEALNWALMNGIAKCMKEEGQRDANGVLNLTDALKESNAKAGDWYKDTARRASSYLYSGEKDDDGKGYCNDMVRTATQEWGFDSPLALLCSFVSKRDNGSSCSTGSGDFGYFGDLNGLFRTNIIKKLWDGKNPNPDGAGYFLLFRTAFAGACSPKKNPNASGDFKYVIQQVYNTEDGPDIKEVVYEGKKRSTETLVYTSENLNEVRRSCAYIADKMNEHHKAFADWIEDNPEKAAEVAESEEATNSQGSGTNATSCALEGIGWIVCPAASMIAKFNDELFGILEGLLSVNSSMFDTTGKSAATYNTWKNVRNIANVAFIISFLIIIYSQLSGLGLSNYGVKRMLPRIIIAAILVNISFWICALAVDLSNIIGKSLHDLLVDQISNTSLRGGNGLSTWDDLTGWLLAGAVGAAGVAGATVALGSTSFIGALALLVPFAVVALVAVLTVVAVLIARQAIIIILVVLSPLAFVAYLLPNTESWFDKWRKTFFTLLLIYPVVGLLFGGSQLAAAIIRSGSDNVLVYISSLVVQVVPLFMVPALMKISGGLLGKVGAAVNNPNRGPFDKMKKGGKRVADRERGYKMQDSVNRTKKLREGSGGALGANNTKRRRIAAKIAGIGNINTKEAEQKDEFSKAASASALRNEFAERANKDDSYALSMAGGDPKMARFVKAYGAQAVREEDKKDIDAVRQSLVDKHPETHNFLDGMKTAATGAEKAAYATEIAKRGSGDQFQKALEASMDIGDENERRMVQSELVSNMREDHFGVSDTMRGLMSSGALTRENLASQSAGGALPTDNNGNAFKTVYEGSVDDRLKKKMSPEAVVSMKPHDMTVVKKLISDGTITDDALTEIVSSMSAARQNENTNKNIKGETRTMFEAAEALASARASNTPPTSP